MFRALLIGYLIWVLLTSAVALALYAWDKRQAKADGWRVPEERLHWIALIGGWPGAWAGQRLFRHKTQKASFRWMLRLAIATHLALVLAAIAFWRRVG